MRLWSVHPKHLDTKGLVALWREALLAKHVLEGKTVGYLNHPQLNRFKQAKNPGEAINQYLSHVYEEATLRGYNFNKDKIDWGFNPSKLNLTTGQLKYETTHLLSKLKIRDTKRYKELSIESEIKPHPLFKLIEGDIEAWEMVANNRV
jgi:hypothetical protein